jgi:hypothetical protein
MSSATDEDNCETPVKSSRDSSSHRSSYKKQRLRETVGATDFKNALCFQGFAVPTTTIDGDEYVTISLKSEPWCNHAFGSNKWWCSLPENNIIRDIKSQISQARGKPIRMCRSVNKEGLPCTTVDVVVGGETLRVANDQRTVHLRADAEKLAFVVGRMRQEILEGDDPSPPPSTITGSDGVGSSDDIGEGLAQDNEEEVEHTSVEVEGKYDLKSVCWDDYEVVIDRSTLPSSVHFAPSLPGFLVVGGRDESGTRAQFRFKLPKKGVSVEDALRVQRHHALGQHAEMAASGSS